VLSLTFSGTAAGIMEQKLAGDPKSAPELCGRAYAELAQYVYPKRKAVERSGTGDGPRQIVVERLERPGAIRHSEGEAGSDARDLMVERTS
jgi:hypothetical protein